MFKVRVSCIVACGEDVALIFRNKDKEEYWSLLGGNVGDSEDVESAIARELAEELNLQVTDTQLFCLQDMLIHRPDKEGLYRKLHIVFFTHIEEKTRNTLNTIEEDDLAIGEIRWVNFRTVKKLHLYPNIGDYLSELPSLFPPPTPRILPAITDANFTWV